MRRLIYISQAENRSPSNQFNFMLRNNISYFERVHGRIDPSKVTLPEAEGEKE